MNIFILDNDIKTSAESLCDKHLVKMVLETAQLLCSQFNPGDAPYKRTHYNHPCSTWCRENSANYLYLIEYGLYLCDEYTYRYNKVHKSAQVIQWCKDNIALLKLPYSQSVSPFAQAVPNDFKSTNAVNTYREYYLNNKRAIATWNRGRNPPTWWK